MPKVLRALEFYSGIGGLHYASVLFNHLAQHQELYNNFFSNDLTGTPGLKDVLFPHPDNVWSQKGPLRSSTKESTYRTQKQKLLTEDAKVELPFIQVVESFEINTLANDVYEFNFGKRPKEGLIDRVTAEQMDSYKADIFLMSPPCQPYTRGGLQKDEEDARASSFHHLLITVLPNMTHPPKYLLLENVQCFESSQSCSFALSKLRSLGYHCEQFLLSPRQFGIPNQRSRFFLLATKLMQENIPQLPISQTDENLIFFHIPQNIHFKHKHLATTEELETWDNPDHAFSRILCTLPPSSTPHSSSFQPKDEEKYILTPDSDKREKDDVDPSQTKAPILIPTKTTIEPFIPTVSPLPVGDFLIDRKDLSLLSSKQMMHFLNGKETQIADETFSLTSMALLPPSLLSKSSAWCIDIVDPSSRSVTCFTKAYTTFIRGSGSILQTRPQSTWVQAIQVKTAIEQLQQPSPLGHHCEKEHKTQGEKDEELQRPLHERGLRYFDPREVANLHFFPPSHVKSDVNSASGIIQSQAKKMKISDEQSLDQQRDDVIAISDHVEATTTQEKRKLTKAERIAIRKGQHLPLREMNQSNSQQKRTIYEDTESYGDNYMCFTFPDHITFKQRQRMLGNSLNVYVVSQLLMRMLRQEF